MLRIDSQAGRPSGRSVEPDDSSSPIRPESGIEAIRRTSPVEERRRELPEDRVTLSPRGVAAAEAEKQADGPLARGAPDEEAELSAAAQRAALPESAGEEAEDGKTEESSRSPRNEAEDPNELTPEEAEAVRDLKVRDREVRAHEQAHLSAAGPLANGGMHLEYERGPDGKRYAASGHVKISLRRGRTPEETLRLARQAQQAALAPADPSPQDRRVAAKAADMQREARQELQQEKAEEAREARGQPEAEHAADPTRPTKPSEVSESAPSDARPDPVQIQAAEAQAQQVPRPHPGAFEAAKLDKERDPLAIGLSRRAVQAYSGRR